MLELDEETAALEQAAIAAHVSGLSTEEQEAVAQSLQRAQENAIAQRNRVLDALTTTLKAKRQEAIDGRAASGIELQWIEDEDAYDGIDNANREEEGQFRPRKPVAGGTTDGTKAHKSRGSTVFLNITAPYTDAASARVQEMLMPTDDRNWQFKPTAIPDQGRPVSYLDQPQAAEQQQLRVAAQRSVDLAQQQVDDWLTETNYHSHIRRGFDDCARLGTMVIKGPFPVARRSKKVAVGSDGQTVIDVVTNIVPSSRRIDPWDFYPDPACGESVQNGRYTWEKDRLTARTLADLRGQGYFDDQIDGALKEGPQDKTYTASDAGVDWLAVDAQFETWYGYCVLDADDLTAIGVDVGDDEPMVPVMVQMVNDRIIRIAENPLSGGSFPYDLLPWTPIRGMPWGRGVARRIRTPQRIVNAATRNMQDNAGLSAGIILVLNRTGLTPADGPGPGAWELHGRKVFLVDSNESATRAAQDAVATIQIPSRTPELLRIIEFALSMAEKTTGMPLLLQGQLGDAPDTLGGQQLANNNANTFLRRVARIFDDNLTEPHIKRYYEWLLEYGDNPDAKREMIVDARGSSALVERDIQNQWIMQMGQMVDNPAYRINPAKWFEEFSKSVRFDPKRIQYTEDEFRQLQSQPQPAPYQVDVAKINAEARLQTQQLDALAAERRAVIALLGEEKLSAQDIKARLMEIVTRDRRERDLFVAERAVKEQFGEGL